MVNDPTDPAGAIALCPSAPHRAVLGLVRAALGRPVGPALVADLEASDPQEIVRIATFNYVHVLLASAFRKVPELASAVPGDLVIYFREMQAGNLRRNEAIRAQLHGIAAALEAEGVRGVVLKGGAELLDPLYPDPAFRFLSDLDILLPEADIPRVVARLHTAGASAVETAEISEIDSQAHHHVAPLEHPGWPVPLELHKRLGQGALRDLLPAEVVLAGARATTPPGLSLPSPAHRLAHAVQHAQLQPPRYRDGLLSLRDAVELEVLRSGCAPDDVAAARALFDAEGQAAWDALDASCALLFGEEKRVDALSGGARRWAERAIADFGRPGRRRVGLLGRWAGWYAKEILTNPARRRHYLARLKKPGSLRRILADQRERWRRTR